MPLVERVLDRSNALVTAETKSAIGTGARDILAKIEGTVYGMDAKVRGRLDYALFCLFLGASLLKSKRSLPTPFGKCLTHQPRSHRRKASSGLFFSPSFLRRCLSCIFEREGLVAGLDTSLPLSEGATLYSMLVLETDCPRDKHVCCFHPIRV